LIEKFKNDLQTWLLNVWEFSDFTSGFFKKLFVPPYNIPETIRQFFQIGWKSFPLVSVTGTIIGLTLALQLKPVLSTFGAESLIPSTLAISIIREIGPVIIALICAGKMGSGIGAELGSMKVTEQIAAMEVSATYPLKYLVSTRVIATTLMVPLLIIYADALALLGGFIAVNVIGDMSLQLYYLSIFSSLSFADVLPATVKTFFFGFIIGIVGCYKGYNCSRGTESVGVAANSAVVLASLLIIVTDLIMVQISTLLF